MISYYIRGNRNKAENVVKTLKHEKENYNIWLSYSHDFKCHEIKLSRNMNSTKFYLDIKKLCKDACLEFDVFEFVDVKYIKNMSYFDTKNDFFDYLHGTCKRHGK